MRYLSILFILMLFGCKVSTPSSAQTQEKKDISSFTLNMKKYPGYFNFYWDEDAGKIYLEVNRIDQEFLYVNSLAAGVGSNDIGLDRGQLGNERIVRFERHGNKLLLIQPNYRYRAVSDNMSEVKAVKEAFASSALFGAEIQAKSSEGFLIDVTPLLLSDSHGIAQRLSSRKQGSYKLDTERSAL
jgi:hypothetical protein